MRAVNNDQTMTMRRQHAARPPAIAHPSAGRLEQGIAKKKSGENKAHLSAFAVEAEILLHIRAGA